MADKFRHVITGNGWHRIECDETDMAGEYTNYQGIATFFDERDNQLYCAVTGYHESGSMVGRGITPGIVYLLTPQAHIRDESHAVEENRHDYLIEQPGFPSTIMRLITEEEAQRMRDSFSNKVTVTRIE